VYAVRPENKQVVCTDGTHISYDKLLVATGANIWVPPVKGLEMERRKFKIKNVFALRTDEHQTSIKQAIEKGDIKKVVVIGASFIGSECAASLKMHFKDTVDIQMVNGESVPFELTLGKEIGAYYQKEHEANGITIHNKVFVKEVHAKEDGSVKSVTLSNGTELDADLVIVGTGVRPVSHFLEDSGVERNKDGGVVCDPFLQTSVKDVYAAGDLASYPYWPTGARTRTEHWSVALDQGTYAAFNMLDKYVPYDSIPFFWTRHYNKSLQFIGSNAVGYKEVFIKGKMHKDKFLAYYIDD